MGSLEVVSLFPSIPFELFQASIKRRWKQIKKHTNLPQKKFLNGFETFMDSLYFECNKEYYQQKNGLPMGL